mmetsp:Transcript_3018/g.3321  ORF Transcript_3018/g.3321 Transcript_3018/m.3321 type:complete len:317 (-) Transcript_3018:396-1346(-)
MHHQQIPTIGTITGPSQQNLKRRAQSQHRNLTVKTTFIALHAIHNAHQFTGPHPSVPQRRVVALRRRGGPAGCEQGVIVQFLGGHVVGGFVQERMIEDLEEFRRRCRIDAPPGRFTLAQEPLPRLGHRTQHQHVPEIQILERFGILPGRTQPPFVFHRRIVPFLLDGFPTGDLLPDPTDHLRRNHGVQSTHGLIKIHPPRIILGIIPKLLKTNPLVDEFPNVGTVVPRVLLGELIRIVIILAGHVPPCPPVQLEIVLLGINLADGVRDFIIVDGVDLAGFGIAFEEFLGDVFAGSHHVDGVEAEIGFVAQVAELRD